LDLVKGRSIYIKWGFTAALIHYWSGGCKPLDDDDDLLRGICETDESNWSKTRAFIFDSGKLFTQDKDDRWIYSPILPEWEKACSIYAGKVKGGQMRGAQRHEQASSKR
jgi:hypothetical protein